MVLHNVELGEAKMRHFCFFFLLNYATTANACADWSTTLLLHTYIVHSYTHIHRTTYTLYKYTIHDTRILLLLVTHIFYITDIFYITLHNYRTDKYRMSFFIFFSFLPRLTQLKFDFFLFVSHFIFNRKLLITKIIRAHVKLLASNAF